MNEGTAFGKGGRAKQLAAIRNSVLRFCGMRWMLRADWFGSVMFFMELLGAIRAFEFMALAGNTQQSGGQHNQ